MGSMKQPTDHVLTFGGAGSIRITDAGKYVRIIEAGDDVYIKLDDVSTELKRAQGSQIGSTGFDRITVRSLVAQTVIICVSDEPQDEDRESIALSVTATVAPGDTVRTVADVSLAAATAGAIVTADATRKTVTIKNPSSNTDSFRIGESGGVAAGRGYELEPGESLTLSTTSAVHGYNAKAGGAQSVSIVEILDV